MEFFYEKYDRNTISEIMDSRYLTRCKLRLDNEGYLSEKYKIKIRNVNNIEIDILKASIIKIGSRFLENVINIQDLKDEDKFKTIQEKYISDMVKYDQEVPVRYFADEYGYIRDIEGILKIISDGILRDQIDITNTKEMIINEIAIEYLKDVIIVELEDIDCIVKCIEKYQGICEEDIYLYDKIDEFLRQYIELWNLINFKQYEHLGIGITRFNTSITTILDLREIKDNSWDKEIRAVLNNVKLIDIDDERVFMFLLSRVNRIEYMDDKNKTLLYISLIEFFLTCKPNKFDLSINKQLKRNIRICYNLIDRDISEKEIGLIYDFRSNLLHGNFKKIKKNMRKISKLEFFNKIIDERTLEDYTFLKELGDDEEEINIDDIKNDNIAAGEIEDILRIRCKEIFSNVYQIYLKDPKFITNIKNKKGKLYRLITFLSNKFKKGSTN